MVTDKHAAELQMCLQARKLIVMMCAKMKK